MEDLKTHELIKKDLDFVLPFFDTFMVVGIELSFSLERRKIETGIVDRQDVTQPVGVLALPHDLIICEVGRDCQVQLVSCSDAEDEPSH